MSKNTEEKVEEKERQVQDRLEYLFDQFNVTNENDLSEFLGECEHGVPSEDEGKVFKALHGFHSVNLALLEQYESNKGKVKTDKVYVGENVFRKIVKADPTPTKEYVQWMLNKFTNMIKNKKKKSGGRFTLGDARQFVEEDLDQTYNYLELFEKNKRKQKFKKLAKTSTTIGHINDPTDINQYDELSQIFDAVDPFIEKDHSGLKRMVDKYVEANEADIEFKDHVFTVFVPRSQESCTIFKDFASWCNTHPNSSYFDRYVREKKRPDGSNSKLYIVIDNDIFKEGGNADIYQLHFESRQLKSRHNEMGGNIDPYERIVSKSNKIGEYFYEELRELANSYQKNSKDKRIDNNPYIDHLISFGFTDSAFEYLDRESAQIIRFRNKPLPYLPDLSRFKDDIEDISIVSTNLADIDPNLGELKNLYILCINDTNLKALPDSIGNLKNLNFLGISDNPYLEYIPDTISELDTSNGGSLEYVTIDDKNPNKEKVERLLPNAFVENEIKIQPPQE